MKVSSKIESLVAYKPGKPIAETQREYGLTHVVKLASNENPLGPSAKVIQALTQAATEIHRYPDASHFELRQTWGKKWNIGSDSITFGNGSNELIDLLIRIFCEPGDCILTSQAAFVAYQVCAQAARCEVIQTPLNENLQFDIPAMISDLDAKAKNCKLIFIANPNNPTGTYVPESDIRLILEKIKNREDVLLVLDEAYNEFVDVPDFPRGVELMREYKNLVLLRTLSKAYGLAGLRVGALLAQPQIVHYVDKVRNPFNVNSLAVAAALAAATDFDYLNKSLDTNKKGLAYFYKELSNLGLKFWPSQGNFVLFDTGFDSQVVFQALLKRGVILRPVKNYGLNTQLRMSVGLQEENEFAISKLTEVLAELRK